MKFEELEKLQIEKWDGKPITCYVNKGLTNEITPDSIEITKVVSFNAEAQHPWGDNRGRVYHSVYPVHPNGDCIKSLGSLRMTNRGEVMKVRFESFLREKCEVCGKPAKWRCDKQYDVNRYWSQPCVFHYYCDSCNKLEESNV